MDSNEAKRIKLEICGECKKSMIGKKPRDLPCGHTFCNSCISIIFCGIGKTMNSRTQCHTCIETFEATRIEHFPDNIHLDFMESVRPFTLPHCKGCAITGDTSSANHHFVQCNIDLCDECEPKTSNCL